MRTDRRSGAGEWCASAVGGLSVLGVLRAAEPWLGFALPLNAPSLAVAAVLGLPGVVGLLALRVLFWLL